MAVYREGFKIVQTIQNQSKQIYPDACDHGILVKKGDTIFNLAKQLADMYSVKGSRKESRYSTGVSVETKIELINEWAISDEIMTLEEATCLFTLSYTSISDSKFTKAGYIGIVSVN